MILKEATFAINWSVLYLQVLVIGGGDGGVVRELDKMADVKQITMCEIDEVCVKNRTIVVVFPDQGMGYLSFSMDTLPLLPPQSFLSYVDLLNSVYGYILVRPQWLLFCGPGLSLEERWRPSKGQNFVVFLHLWT